VPLLHQQGVWAMLHEARVDFSMVLGLLFLLIVGGGPLAMTRPREREGDADATVMKRRGSFEDLQS
jgi:hypothetical protein